MVSKGDFPWLQCNQSWNTDDCHPFFANHSTLEFRWDFHRRNSVSEFSKSIYEYNPRNVFGHLLVWIFALLPLWKGPTSLIRSFYAILPAFLILNTLLFFRGVTLGGVSVGLARVVEASKMLRVSWVFIVVFFSSWCHGNHGYFFFLGRHIEENTFALPNIYKAFTVGFVFKLMHLFEVAGYYGHYKGLFDSDSPQNGYFHHYDLPSLTISLTRVPAATFWLVLQFAFLLCMRMPYYSFALETVASSLAEVIPCCQIPRLKILESRSKFPQNMIND